MSVHIYDNFLNEYEFKKLLTEINKREYTWGHSSANGDNEYPWLTMNLDNCEYAHHILNTKIEPIVNMRFDTERIYLNGMMYGSQSAFHKDSNKDNARTFLYFIHECTYDDADKYGGYFYYKLNNEIRCIEPIQNRGIFFNGNILHKGVSFDRCTGLLRQSIAWKLYINTDNQTFFTNNETSNTENISVMKNTDNTQIESDKQIHQDILSIIDDGNDNSYPPNNSLDIFKPLMELTSYKHIQNCDKSINICFESEEEYSISKTFLKKHK